MKTFILRNYTIKISDKFKCMPMEFAFSKEEADERVNAIYQKKVKKADKGPTIEVIDTEWLDWLNEVEEHNKKSIPNTIEAINIHKENGEFVCFLIIDRDDFDDYINNHTLYTYADDNVIKIYYSLEKDKEEGLEIVNAYTNFIKLASEYNTYNSKEKSIYTKQYESLTDKDKAVIDFNPDSAWYKRNDVPARRGLILKCANQFLLDELSGKESAAHKLYTLGFVEDEYKDIKNALTLTNIHYACDGKKNLTADQIRLIQIQNPNVKSNYHTMKYERTDDYRRSLKENKNRNRCVYCGHIYANKYIEADHIIPVHAVSGKRGSFWKWHMKIHKYTLGVNDPKNIAPACIYCNRRKGKKQGIWILLGHLGRHTSVWTLRVIMLLALIIYTLIHSFGSDATSYIIYPDKLFITVAIIGLWVANCKIHDMLVEKAYKKRESNK